MHAEGCAAVALLMHPRCCLTWVRRYTNPTDPVCAGQSIMQHCIYLAASLAPNHRTWFAAHYALFYDAMASRDPCPATNNRACGNIAGVWLPVAL
jgi:hypothetical protein